SFTNPLHDFWIYFALLLCIFGSSASQLSYSITEEANKGFVVGNIAKDFNLNVQELDTRGLRVVSSYSKEYFNVNLQSGNLFVKERIDREELCPNTAKCSLRIQAVLNSPMTAHRDRGWAFQSKAMCSRKKNIHIHFFMLTLMH
uniref:Cadherin N-terminal domain-containing protein n=1 Tax=Hippocampus comes TaxID=109280 RepID=A0A3Q2Y2S6_HIPCM